MEDLLIKFNRLFEGLLKVSRVCFKVKRTKTFNFNQKIEYYESLKEKNSKDLTIGIQTCYFSHNWDYDGTIYRFDPIILLWSIIINLNHLSGLSSNHNDYQTMPCTINRKCLQLYGGFYTLRDQINDHVSNIIFYASNGIKRSLR